MIIRSGLIQRIDGVDDSSFKRHWIEVHGPLAMRLPNLRGYAQNLVTRHGPAGGAGRLHRIDGLSQLWFDDVDAMVSGMSSPENDACVTDIGRFLAKVTLAVQNSGRWQGSLVTRSDFKLMAIFAGDASYEEIGLSIASVLHKNPLRPTAWRLNSLAEGQFIVDRAVPHDEARLVAVLEAYFPSEAEREAFIDRAVLDGGAFPPASVMAVSETVLLEPPNPTD